MKADKAIRSFPAEVSQTAGVLKEAELAANVFKITLLIDPRMRA
jgi:hypothetical protein